MKKKVTHAAINRMQVVQVGELPEHLTPDPISTTWEGVIRKAYKHAGQWFKITREYKNGGSAVWSARRAAEEVFSDDICARLETATEELAKDRYIVYLRFSPATPEPPEDLSGRFDEPDSIADSIASTVPTE